MSRTLLLLSTLAFGQFLSAPLSAQCINEKLTYPIYKAGADRVRDLDAAGKEIVHVEYDLLFDSKDMYRSLSTDWSYTFTAFADAGVADVDVAVFEYDDLLEEYSLVAADSSYEVAASVTYTPVANVMHMVRVSVKSWVEGYTAARYGLLIHHD